MEYACGMIFSTNLCASCAVTSVNLHPSMQNLVLHLVLVFIYNRASVVLLIPATVTNCASVAIVGKTVSYRAAESHRWSWECCEQFAWLQIVSMGMNGCTQNREVVQKLSGVF